jgi:hypothetical protein
MNKNVEIHMRKWMELNGIRSDYGISRDVAMAYKIVEIRRKGGSVKNVHRLDARASREREKPHSGRRRIRTLPHHRSDSRITSRKTR